MNSERGKATLLFSLGLTALMLAQCLMLLRYFAEFPIFPEYNSADFNQAIGITLAVLRGPLPLSSEVLYGGVHHVLALALFVTGGEPTIVVRHTMAAMTVLCTPLMYLATKMIFSSRAAGFFSAAVYSLTGAIWFGLVFNAGLYPQFYGLIATLLLIAASLNYVRADNHRAANLILLILALLNAAVSHYSVLMVFPALIIVMGYSGIVRNKNRTRSIVLIALLVIPLGLGLVIFSSVTSTLLGFLVGNTTGVLGTTPLATWLSPIPVLSYLADEITNDVGTLVAFALAALSLLWIRRNPESAIAPLWFASVIVVAPFNAGAWRFSFIALTPLAMMAGAGLAILVPRVSMGGKQIAGLSLACLCMGGMLYGSWGQKVIMTASDEQATAQVQVYQAIQWLKANTSSSSVYYSVSDWRFTYMTYSLSRDTAYGFSSNVTDAFQTAAQYQISKRVVVPHNDAYTNLTWYLPPVYMIVTKFVTENLPANPALYPWNTFGANANMTLVYTNPDVEVYLLTTITSCHFLPQLAPIYVVECPLGGA